MSDNRSTFSRRAALGAVAVGVPAAALAWPSPAGADDVSDAVEEFIGVISVADYTVLPGPSIDGNVNRVNLQTAVNAAVSAGQTLYFPAGQYNLTFTSSANQISVNGNLTMLAPAAGAELMVGPDAPTFVYRVFMLSGGANLTVDGLSIGGPPDAGPNGTANPDTNAFLCEPVPAGEAGSLRLSGVSISGSFQNAIEVAAGTLQTGSFDLSISDGFVQGYRRGIYMSQGRSSTGRCFITNAFVTATMAAGQAVSVQAHVALRLAFAQFAMSAASGAMLSVFGPPSGVTIVPEYSEISNCLFPGVGTITTGNYVPTTFRACYFRPSSAGQTIQFSHDAFFLDCRFEPSYPSGQTSQVIGGSGGHQVTIDGCTFDMAAASGLVQGVGLTVAGDSARIRNTVFRTTSNTAGITWVTANQPSHIVDIVDCDFQQWPSTATNAANLGVTAGTYLLARLRAFGHGVFDNGFVCVDVPTGSTADVTISDCDFSGLTVGPAIEVMAGSGIVRGYDNLFTDSTTNDYACAAGGTGEIGYLTPRRGLSTTVAATSGSTGTIGWNADTWHIDPTGVTPTLANLRVNNRDTQQRMYSGTVRLIADGSFTLEHNAGGSGSILTQTGANRAVQPGSVVTLTHDPTTLTWVENA